MPVLTTEPHRPRSPAATGLVDVAVLGLALLLMAALTWPLLRVPDHVERVVVSNPGPWTVSVQLVDPDGRPRLALGTVGSASEQTFTEVLDQGVEWVFRFSYAGQEADLHRAGRQLADAGWRVAVPEALGDRLRAAGVPRSTP